MRILICDDDSSIRQQIQKLIVSYFKSVKQKVPEIICYCSGEDLLKDLGPMDMVFLDIEMPGMDGIYVGNKLKERNKNVIIYIVTSFMEYLDEAMRIHVFRYLPKPLEKHRFFRNLKDGLTLYHTLTIFCNLLDNAFQAARQVPEGYVELYVCKQPKTPFVSLSLINSCRKDPFSRDGKLLLPRKDKNGYHGYGIKSVEKIVKKYHGEMKMYYDTENQTFHTILYMKVNR